MSRTLEQRFWAKVDKSGECWIWTASVRGPGYGQCSIGKGKQGYAHRFSYELTYGPIPDGLVIDHACHRKLCVRPTHLRAITQKQNMENQGRLYSNNKSGVRGVWWVARLKKWRGSVRHHGEIAFAEWFTTLEEAESAVLAKRNELFTHNDLDRRAA